MKLILRNLESGPRSFIVNVCDNAAISLSNNDALLDTNISSTYSNRIILSLESCLIKMQGSV